MPHASGPANGVCKSRTMLAHAPGAHSSLRTRACLEPPQHSHALAVPSEARRPTPRPPHTAPTPHPQEVQAPPQEAVVPVDSVTAYPLAPTVQSLKGSCKGRLRFEVGWPAPALPSHSLPQQPPPPPPRLRSLIEPGCHAALCVRVQFSL